MARICSVCYKFNKWDNNFKSNSYYYDEECEKYSMKLIDKFDQTRNHITKYIKSEVLKYTINDIAEIIAEYCKFTRHRTFYLRTIEK
jgi:hypothetical protein